MSRCANAASRELELGEEARPTLAAKDYVSSRSKDRKLFRRVSEARIEPVGFVLRVICVTIAPSYDRGYDGAMVTQVTLNAGVSSEGNPWGPSVLRVICTRGGLPF